MLLWEVAFSALALSTAVDAQGIQFQKVYDKKPELANAKNTPTSSVDTQSSAASVIRHMNSMKGNSDTSPDTTTDAGPQVTSNSTVTSISARITPASPVKTPPSSLLTTVKSVKAKKPKKTTTTTTTTTTTKKKKPKTTTKAQKNQKKKVQKKVQSLVPRQDSGASCMNNFVKYGYTPSPNTPNGFLVDSTLFGLSKAALPYPAGYTTSFINAYGAVTGTGFMSFYSMASYDVAGCAKLCTSIPTCQAFNVYFERSPLLVPGTSCSNPTAATDVRCTLWSIPINVGFATNTGQWRNSFMDVIQGSNGYNKITTPATPTGYSAPTALGGAIDASSLGATVSLGSNFYTTGVYNPQVCADFCTSTSTAAKACNFFNSFEINLNGVFQGTYCQLYTGDVSAYQGLYTSVSNGVSYDLGKSYGFAVTGNTVKFTPTPVTTTVSLVPGGALPTIATTAARTSATPVARNCADIGSKTFTSLNGITYNLICGVDQLGGFDTGNTVGSGIVRSFTDCFTLCDTAANCNAFSLNGGNCYFKNLTTVTSGITSLWWVSFAWVQGGYPGALNLGLGFTS